MTSFVVAYADHRGAKFIKEKRKEIGGLERAERVLILLFVGATLF